MNSIKPVTARPFYFFIETKIRTQKTQLHLIVAKICADPISHLFFRSQVLFKKTFRTTLIDWVTLLSLSKSKQWLTFESQPLKKCLFVSGTLSPHPSTHFNSASMTTTLLSRKKNNRGSFRNIYCIDLWTDMNWVTVR